MSEFHRLDPAADARFLDARVADPLTGVPFQPANTVVLCARCGQVSLRETWEAIGGCPNGHDTPTDWDVDAALAAGDGARVARPVAPPPPVATPVVDAPRRSRGLPLVLAVLGVAALVIGGIVVAGLLTDEDEAPVAVVEDAPTAPTGPRAVAVEAGETEGALTEDDFLGETGRYQDLYTVAADSSGRLFSFVVSSDEFFPDLYVETPDGERVEAETSDNDGDEGVTRTVAVRDLRGPGLYRVFVSSRRPEATGSYRLRVRAADPSRPLRAGASAFEAELGTFSQRAAGYFRDRYTFSGAAGREHVVTVRSSAFAPTVAITGPGGAVGGETGRAGGSVTFTFTPERSGTHTLVVSSRTADQRGRYTVQLVVEPEPEPEPEVRARPLPTDGRAVSDSLAAGDTEAFGFTGRLGDRVRVEVRSGDFTPSLTLVAPNGTRTPASPDGDRARVEATLASAGTYRVIVGASGGGGAYRVTLDREAAVTADDIPRMPGADRPAPAPPPAPVPDPDDGEGGGGEPYRAQPIDGAP